MRVCAVEIVRQAARSERICLPSSPLAVEGKVGWKTMRDTTMAIPPSLGGEDSKTALGARGLLSVGMSGIKIIATREVFEVVNSRLWRACMLAMFGSTLFNRT